MDFNTGTGSGGNSEGQPEQDQGLHGERIAGSEVGFDYRDPVQSFIGTVRSIVTGPVSFFSGIARQGDFLNPLIFAVICAAVYGVISGVLGFLGALIGGNGIGTAIATLFGSVILSPIFGVIGLFVGAGVTHLFVMLFVKPENAGFEATFRVGAYAFVVYLAAWLTVIPILGILVGLAVLVYLVFLWIVGIRETHSTTTGRAAAVVLLPTAVLILIGIILLVLVGLALFAAFSGLQ